MITTHFLNTFAILGIFEVLIMLLLIPLALVAFGFWVWMLVDCATKEPSGTEKIVWILIIIFTQLLGALLYFFIRRRQRIKELGR